MIRRTGPSRSPTPNGGHDQRETAAANGVAASNQLFGAVVLRHDQRPDRPRRRDPEGALRRPSGSCRHRAGLRALGVAALAQRMQRLPCLHTLAPRGRLRRLSGYPSLKGWLWPTARTSAPSTQRPGGGRLFALFPSSDVARAMPALGSAGAKYRVTDALCSVCCRRAELSLQTGLPIEVRGASSDC